MRRPWVGCRAGRFPGWAEHLAESIRPRSDDLLLQIVAGLAGGDLGGCAIDVETARRLAWHGLAWDVDRLASPAVYTSPEAAATISNASRRALMRSMSVAVAANRVARTLADANVPALVYKGPALAFETTGSFLGRGSADVDFLVNPAQLGDVHRVLVADGLWRRDGDAGPPGRLTMFQECERSYVGAGIDVDLHWRIDSTPGYFSEPFEALWARRRKVSAAGLEVWAPGASHALVMTAVHGTREMWVRLRWVLDAVRQFRLLSPAQWPEVCSVANAGARKAVAVALAIAEICGVDDLPARPGRWARSMAQAYLDAVVSTSPADARAAEASAMAAWSRRVNRWQTADTQWTAFDGVARATFRQVAGDAQKSLLRRGPGQARAGHDRSVRAAWRRD